MATRMIMSKFEVLQNHRIDDEIRNLRHNINKSIELSKKSHIYSMGSWQLSRFIIACFTGYICIQFFYRAQIEGISTQLVAEIGVVTGLMATFMSYFNLLIEWYTNFTKEFVHVEKLWDTFDDLKTIDNYDIGDSFKCRKGDYEARGLFFSYTPVIPVLSDFSLQIQ